MTPNPTFERLGWTIQPYDNDLARVTLLGRYPIRVRPELAEAVTAMDVALIASGYENPCDFVGSWNYRTIAGTDLASGHAYAVCVDVDYGGDNPDSPDHPGVDRNPHVHRQIVAGDAGFGVKWQFTESQVRIVEAIRNVDGEQIWQWLGWPIGDTMHWQPLVGPDACIVDWETVYTGATMPNIAWTDWIEGWVEGLDEEHVRKLHDAGVISGDVSYWIGLLATPADPAWRYFYTRAQASVWAKIGG